MSTAALPDPRIFNAALYERLLSFWLPTWPTPSSRFSKHDVLRWFVASSDTDEHCRTITGRAVDALDTAAVPLPPFVSLEDREMYSTIAKPLVAILDYENEFPRVNTALALMLIVDQMPRNLFRHEPRIAFAHSDRLARAFSAHVREVELDRAPFFKSPV